MILSLRSKIERLNLPVGVQLTDCETGFALELEPEYVELMDGEGSGSGEFWTKLKDLGFTNATLDLKEIRKLQRNALKENRPPLLLRLKERLAEIRKDIPFFQKRATYYDPNLLYAIEDFASIPFMRKKDLRENFPNGLIPKGIDVAEGINNGTLTIMSTSGSTEDRLQIIAQTEIDRVPFGCDDLFGVHIGGKQPKTAFFTTPVCSGTECRLGNSTFEERKSKVYPDLYLNSTNNPFSIQRSLINSFCEDILQFQPKILAANPIYLQCLIRRANELGMKLPKVPFIQYGFEFGHQASIRNIKHAFGVPTLNDYGASEENRLALQCHRGALHVRSDVVHIEIINKSGYCPPGVVGAVVVTTFDTLTPLVRYLIGDAAAWTGKVCDCAFSDWSVIQLHGRLKDMMFSNDRWVSTFDIDNAIGSPDWLDFYRINEVDKNHYDVQVIPALGASANFKDLTEKLSKFLNPKKLYFKEVSRFDPLHSMKIGITKTNFAGAPEIP